MCPHGLLVPSSVTPSSLCLLQHDSFLLICRVLSRHPRLKTTKLNHTSRIHLPQQLLPLLVSPALPCTLQCLLFGAPFLAHPPLLHRSSQCDSFKNMAGHLTSLLFKDIRRLPFALEIHFPYMTFKVQRSCLRPTAPPLLQHCLQPLLLGQGSPSYSGAPGTPCAVPRNCHLEFALCRCGGWSFLVLSLLPRRELFSSRSREAPQPCFLLH